MGLASVAGPEFVWVCGEGAEVCLVVGLGVLLRRDGREVEALYPVVGLLLLNYSC